MKSNTIALKLSYDSVLKRVRKTPKTMSQLQSLVYSEFPELLNQPLRVHYTDLDGDNITVTTDDGLSEAFQQTKEQNGTVLKFNISIENKSENLSESKKLSAPNLSEIDNSLAESIKEITIEEIKNCRDKIHDIAANEAIRSFLVPAEKILNNTIHKGIKCSACKAYPIVGARYKCATCANYNLCESCESRQVHDYHLFLKLVNEQGLKEPTKVSPVPKEEMKKVSKRLYEKKWQDLKESRNKKLMEAVNIEQMAHVVGSNVKEITGAPGDIVMVKLDYDNLSDRAWPANSYIARLGGNILFDLVPIPEGLEPGKAISLFVPVELPYKRGAYKLKLRLKGDDKFFGQIVLIVAKVFKQKNEEVQKPKIEGTDTSEL